MSEPLTALTDPAALGEAIVLPDDQEPAERGMTPEEADAFLRQPVEVDDDD